MYIIRYLLFKIMQIKYLKFLLVYFQIYESYSGILCIINMIFTHTYYTQIQNSFNFAYVHRSLSNKTHFPFQPLEIYISWSRDTTKYLNVAIENKSTGLDAQF